MPFTYACQLRRLPNGDLVLISYDVIDSGNAADWLSERIVKLSAAAAASCLVPLLHSLLPTKQTVSPTQLNESCLMQRITRFSGYPTTKKFDIESSLVLLLATPSQTVRLLPSRREPNSGFSHLDHQAIDTNLSHPGFLQHLQTAFARCLPAQP